RVKRFNEWTKKNESWLDHRKIQENLELMAFEERNVQNEMNLLTMALARLKDPEQILYMQRNYSKLEAQNQEMQRKIYRLERDISRSHMPQNLDKAIMRGEHGHSN